MADNMIGLISLVGVEEGVFVVVGVIVAVWLGVGIGVRVAVGAGVRLAVGVAVGCSAQDESSNPKSKQSTARAKE
jgi:hypothetical protein